MSADPTPPPVPEALPLPAVEMAALRLFAGFDLAENAAPDVIALAWEKLTDTEREQWRYAARSALTVAATLIATPAYDRGVAAGRTAAAAAIRQYVKEWDAAKNTGAYSKGLHAAARIAERTDHAE